MEIEYDPSLIENAVFLASHSDTDLHKQLHVQTDPLYDITAPRQRQREFQQAYKSFFLRLQLAQPIEDTLHERPELKQSIDHCFVRAAARRKAQQAELFINSDSPSVSQKTLFVDLAAESVLKPQRFQAWLRRDLLHVADMLDAEFGYQKESLLGNSPRQNLNRDRYSVLWDIYVEGRLTREGRGDDQHKQRLSRQFEKAFGCLPVCMYPPEFDTVFQEKQLTHDQLMRWAAEPEILHEQATNEPRLTNSKQGELCPICGFSTYDWCHAAEVDPRGIETMKNDHPAWDANTGVCRLCAELYTSRCGNGSGLQEIAS